MIWKTRPQLKIDVSFVFGKLSNFVEMINPFLNKILLEILGYNIKI